MMILALLNPFWMSAQVIHEVMPANFTTWVDEAGDPDDWVEIYNNTLSNIDLSGWYVSDNASNLQKWQLPTDADLIIPPGGYLILVADGEPDEGPTHLSFSFKQSGDQCYLSQEETLIATAEWDFLWQDMSAGWDGDEWVVFDIPTPGLANNDVSYLGVLEAPSVFPPSQLSFEGEGEPAEVLVTLYHDLETADIYYTLDGSTPNEFSFLYEGPFEVEGSATVNARAFHPLFIESPTASAPFLFGLESTLDVISISLPEMDFTGSGGINSVNNGVEVAANVTFFNEEGTIEKSQTMGMKRHAVDQNDQHGFRLLSRGIYGSSKLEMDLFDIRTHDTYNHLILRNCGNDAIENNGAGLRDPLISSLFHDIDPTYGMSAYKPVSVYVNGEYWGFYNLRERQDHNWLEINYGLQCDDVDYLERTADQSDTRDEHCGDWTAYDNLETEAIEQDLTDPVAYASVTDKINVRNLIDYQTIEVWAINQDWLSNNMKFFRPYDDPEWNWVLWDVDWGLGTYYPAYPHGYPDWNALSFSLSDWGGWTSAVETELMQNLVENTDFAHTYASRAADLLNSVLRPDRVSEKLLNMQSVIEEEVPLYVDRWGGNVDNWEEEVEYMLSFIADRPEYMRTHFSEQFGLGERDTIDLDVLPLGAGYIEVNTIYTDELPWEGVYFELVPIRLQAIPEPGFVFDHWEGLPEGMDIEAQEIWVDLLEAPEVVAVFEPATPGDEPIPVITEILYKSSPLAQDWLEIHNPTDLDIPLQNWQLCEGGTCLTLPEMTLAPGEYLAVAEDLEGFQTEYGTAVNAIGGLPFGLNSSGEEVSAFNPTLGLVDVVDYGISSPWPVVFAEGTSIQLLSPELPNQLGENWFATEQHATPGAPNNDVSVSELTASSLSAYPNPFTNVITLQFEAAQSGVYDLRVTDLSGRVVWSRASLNLPSGARTLVLSETNAPGLMSLPANLYVLELTSPQNTLRLPVIHR